MPLPGDTFDRAMAAHLDGVERRVRRLYVRPRALFAEAVVAALIDGTVVEFPAAAWDVEMTLPPRPQPLMGTSIAMIDRTYGHLARDSEDVDSGPSRRESPVEMALRWRQSETRNALRIFRKPAATIGLAGDGAYRDRTGDLRLAKPALSQLS